MSTGEPKNKIQGLQKLSMLAHIALTAMILLGVGLSGATLSRWSTYRTSLELAGGLFLLILFSERWNHRISARFVHLACVLSWSAGLLYLNRHSPGQVDWNEYGFLDKRWVIFSYWGWCLLGVLGPHLGFGPLDWRLFLSDPASAEHTAVVIEEHKPETPLQILKRILGGIGIYFVICGPPWNFDYLFRTVDGHESVHLGVIQSILLGKRAYTQAVTQYAPGVTWFCAQWMRHVPTLTGFREAWVLLNDIGAVIALGITAYLLPNRIFYWLALPLFLFISPQAFFYFHPNGVYDGFIGWAMMVRSIGVFVMVVGFNQILFWRTARHQAQLSSTPTLVLAFVLGLFGGVACLFGQENFGCGISGVGLVVLTHLLSNRRAYPRLIAPVVTLGIGFGIPIAATLSFYASSGEAGEFYRRYFQIGALVARGYTNQEFWAGWWEPWTRMFYFLPPLAVLCSCLAQFAPWERAQNPKIQSLLWGASLSTLVLGVTTLFRSDPARVIGSIVTFPLLFSSVFMTWKTFPLLSRTRKYARLILIGLIVLLPWNGRSSFLQPLRDYSWIGRVRSWTGVAPETRNQSAAWENSDVIAHRLGVRSTDIDLCRARLGRERPPEVEYMDQLGTTKEWIELCAQIHFFIGEQVVWIPNFIFNAGQVYFLADLHPYSPVTEPYMTVVNSDLRREFVRELHAERAPCMIWLREPEELAAFKQGRNLAREKTIATPHGTIHLACAGPMNESAE